MKNRNTFLLFFLFGLLWLGYSCKKDFGPKAHPIAANIKVVFEGSLSNIIPVDAKVTLVSERDGRRIILNTNQQGDAYFESLVPGKFSIEASLAMTGAKFTELTGITTDLDSIHFNGRLTEPDDLKLTKELENRTITIMQGTPGPWVIKQVYYGGSDRWDGANFRDQFIEFYNNTDTLMYADSLYFAQIFGENSATPDLTKDWYLQSGQLDWRISTGMSNANTDFVYAYHLYMIPGTGKQYPVQPGQSIVIAQNALNHKAPYIDNNGNVQTVNNPDLTIDLSGADFEAYLYEYRKKNDPTATPYRWDIDNPQVPNIEVLLSTHNDMILDNLGRDAYVVFTASRHYVDDLMQNHSFKSPKTTQTANKNRFIQIPVDIVMDGVELAQTVPADRAPKRLPVFMDAGFNYLPKGYYASQSVIRKTAKTVNGRKVLKDTNNSSEDFVVVDRAIPKGFYN